MGETGGERDREVGGTRVHYFTYLHIHWLLLVCAQPPTLVYWDDALTH